VSDESTSSIGATLSRAEQDAPSYVLVTAL
jgi:hypothetical protein